MSKKIAIAIFISIVLVLSVAIGIFSYNSSKKITSKPQKTVTSNNAKNETAVNKEINGTNKINCGNVIASHSVPEEKTIAENTTLECLGNAILDCKPVTVNFTGEGSYRYSVDKKENDSCFISQEIDKTSKKTTCKFPLQVLSNNKSYVQENKLENTYFALIAYSLSSSKIKDIKTGETVNLECF